MKLSEISDQLHFARNLDLGNAGLLAYDFRTDEITFYHELNALEEDLMTREHYLILDPDVLDNHRIHHSFIRSVENPSYSEQLLQAIHSKEKYHRFRALIEELNLIEDYYQFKDLESLRLTKEWCDIHQIPYVEE